MLSKKIGLLTCLILNVCFLQPIRSDAVAIDLSSAAGWNDVALQNCISLQNSQSDCQDTLITHSADPSTFSKPLVITKGGTYSGRWLSKDPTVPAVTINTNQTVKIVNSIIAGAGDLIYGRNINAEISNVAGFGTTSKPGKFLDVTVNKSLLIDKNRMTNVWGIRVSGSGTQPTLSITHNIAFNITDGLESRAHFIQLSGGVFPGAKISNNIAINAPSRSHVEDVINLYNSRGLQSNVITVDSNRILGAYPLNPATDSYSGGGIIVDGSANAPVSSASAYINITNNTIISTSNYGLAISSGNNNIISNNTVISSGFVNQDIPIKSQNVGIYIWNINHQSSKTFYANQAFSNKVFWQKITNGDTQRKTMNNWWLPDCAVISGKGCSNTSISLDSFNTGTVLENFYEQNSF